MGRRVRATVVALAVGTIGLTAALAPAVGGAAGSEMPGTVAVGNEAPAWFTFGISPTLLPAGDPGATELKLAVEESPSVGIPPGIEEAKFGLDRSIRLERGDLPVCRRPGVNFPQIESTGADLCPQTAVIGHAEAAIEVAFPESRPLIDSTTGKVYIGGTRRGVPNLLVALPTADPIGGMVAVLVPVRPVRGGRIGSEMTFTAPTLLGGDGFFLNFQLELRRGFAEGGERTGYVTAECRDGKLTAQLDVTFTDGTQYAQESSRACTRHRAH
jgi:hypothetical protein